MVKSTLKEPDFFDDIAETLSFLRKFKKSAGYKKLSVTTRKRLDLCIKAFSGDTEALIALSEQVLNGEQIAW